MKIIKMEGKKSKKQKEKEEQMLKEFEESLIIMQLEMILDGTLLTLVEMDLLTEENLDKIYKILEENNADLHN